MRTLLLLLLSCLCASAQFGLRSPAFVAGLHPTAILLIDETFEGTGTPSGWSVDDGTPDFDNTSAPLSGSQDLLMTDDENDISKSLTSSGELWVRFEFKFSAAPGLGTSILYLNGGTSISLTALASGAVQVSQVGVPVGTETSDVLASGTKYWLFFHVVKGTGVNASYDVEFSTTSTRTGSGNKFSSYTSGIAAANWTAFEVYRSDAGWGSATYEIDNLAISNIGWPP